MLVYLNKYAWSNVKLGMSLFSLRCSRFLSVYFILSSWLCYYSDGVNTFCYFSFLLCLYCCCLTSTKSQFNLKTTIIALCRMAAAMTKQTKYKHCVTIKWVRSLSRRDKSYFLFLYKISHARTLAWIGEHKLHRVLLCLSLWDHTTKIDTETNMTLWYL